MEESKNSKMLRGPVRKSPSCGEKREGISKASAGLQLIIVTNQVSSISMSILFYCLSSSFLFF